MMLLRGRTAVIASGASIFLVAALGAGASTSAAATVAQRGLRPTVIEVKPGSGTSAGNTVVTIKGTNLAAASAVIFGPRHAATIVDESSTQLTVIDPPHKAGVVDVVVTLANGRTSPTSAADRFTYKAGPGKFPTAITGTFTDNWTFGNVPGPVPPSETSTTGDFTLTYDPTACIAEPTVGNDAACYGATSVTGTGLQACYSSSDAPPTLVPFSFGSDQVDVSARIQVDANGVYHLYFDLSAPSAADGPVPCAGDVQNSVIRLFHNPDGLDSASSDTYVVGQGSATSSLQDHGDEGLFGDGVSAPGWSGTADFTFTYGARRT